jgi:hypothetical protein
MIRAGSRWFQGRFLSEYFDLPMATEDRPAEVIYRYLYHTSIAV